MKHKSIFFVSPGGTSTKAIKLKAVSVFAVAVIVAGGFSAYFIPSEKFRLKAAEVKQKQRLSAQNEMLHQRVVSALGMLNRLRQQIVHLDAKKEQVTELTGAKAAARKNAGLPVGTSGGLYAGMDPVALLRHATLLESRFKSCAVLTAQGGGNPFENIPVCKPTPDFAIATLSFGKTKDPFTGRESDHRGMDFAAPPGAPVIATANGTVARVENNEVWGKRVVISHAGNISTVYAHLGTVSTAGGRKLKRGEIIGTIGSSGLSTGPHVHYEIWKNGVAIDPERFFYPARLAGK